MSRNLAGLSFARPYSSFPSPLKVESPCVQSVCTVNRRVLAITSGPIELRTILMLDDRTVELPSAEEKDRLSLGRLEDYLAYQYVPM